jgi:hypothetical protein
MAENSPLIGRTLAGRFRITGYIGEGGMAAVYRGVQDGDGRNVAIKVMNSELVKDRKFVRRFRREAKAASMLKHPNTVEILEFGVDGETVYLAMECIEGLDLAMVLERDRRIPEARAANIVMQVCNALAVAHAQNIVHRDLKPDNIMVLPNPKDRTQEIVKVLDFGIAKILDEDEGPMPDPRAEPQSHAPSLLTRVGTIVGTPAYMSPEQGRAEKVDARTDVYACGVLLYELVTGRTPFGGETPMQVVMRHVNEPPMPPSQWVEMHPELEKVILKALMKWPAERQQSAQALSNELRALMAELAVQKRPLANQGGGGRTATGDQAPPTAAAGSAAMRAAAAAAGSVASNPRPAAGMPAASAPATARAPAPDDNDDEPSTLMIPDGGAAALLAQRPQTGPGLTAAQAAAAAAAAAADKKLVFPTLNIDLPEDLEKAGISVGPRTTPTRGTPSKQPTLESAAPPVASAGPPSDDDDDARTVVRPPTGQGPSLHEIIAGAGPAGLALAQTLASPIEDQPKPAKKAPLPAAGGPAGGAPVAPATQSVAATLASEPATTEGSGVHPVPAGAAKPADKDGAIGLAKTLPIGATDMVVPREAMASLAEIVQPEAAPIKTSGALSVSQPPKKGLSVGMAMVLGALIGAVIVGVLVVVLVSMR